MQLWHLPSDAKEDGADGDGAERDGTEREDVGAEGTEGDGAGVSWVITIAQPAQTAADGRSLPA